MERGLEAKTVRAEAKVLKALQASPHVVRLIEQGTVNERSFMVMEVRIDLHCFPMNPASVLVSKDASCTLC